MTYNEFNGGQIVAFKFLDIQSFGDMPDFVNLSTDFLNMIIAPNETGKSVIFKIFYQMCFSDYFGSDGIQGLIRTGCSIGAAYFKLRNGKTISFILEATDTKKRQVYALTGTDGQYTTWIQTTLPEPIRQELGWIIDFDNRLILNIVDGEHGIPLINDTPQSAANIISFVTESKPLQKTITTLQEWQAKAEEAQRYQKRIVANANAQNNLYKYIDIDADKNQLQLAEEFRAVFVSCKNYSESLYALQYALSTRPAKLSCNLTLAKPVALSALQAKKVLATSQALKSACALLPAKIQQFDLVNAKHVSTLYSAITSASSELKKLETSYSAKTEASNSRIDCTAASLVASTSARIEAVTNKLRHASAQLTEYQAIQKKHQEAAAALQQLKDLIKVCPLCGKPFDSEGECSAHEP